VFDPSVASPPHRVVPRRSRASSSHRPPSTFLVYPPPLQSLRRISAASCVGASTRLTRRDRIRCGRVGVWHRLLPLRHLFSLFHRGVHCSTFSPPTAARPHTHATLLCTTRSLHTHCFTFSDHELVTTHPFTLKTCYTNAPLTSNSQPTSSRATCAASKSHHGSFSSRVRDGDCVEGLLWNVRWPGDTVTLSDGRHSG
jgi:hypothetical protein